MIPWIVACALFMQNLDSTAVTTAIPSMARSLGVLPVQLSTTVSAYVLAVAVFLPASTWAAERFGSRRIFASAIVLFTLASIACGLSTNLLFLVLARTAQGIGGSMMVPVGRLLLLRSVPRHELVTAMARMMMPAFVGPALGPLVGGFLSTYANWRLIFFINIPVGVIGVILALRLIPPDNTEGVAPVRFDLRGFLLAGTALGTTVFALEGLGKAGTSAWLPIALLCGGVTAGTLYMARFRKVERPILDPRVFRYPSFLSGIGGGTIFRIGVSAIPFLMPMLLQIGFGFSAFASGSITFANAIGSMISKPVAIRLLRYFSYRQLLVAITGISGSTLALFLLFRPSTPPLVIFFVLLVGSVARSLQITFSNAVAYADIPDEDTAQANAIANVMQQLAASLAIALAATLLHVGQTLHGDAKLSWPDFAFPFAMLSLLGFGSIVFYWWLPPSTGEDMRTRR